LLAKNWGKVIGQSEHPHLPPLSVKYGSIVPHYKNETNQIDSLDQRRSEISN